MAHNFSSRIGFILSSAGSAIGLGCIWKFPYMAAQNGGSAFFFVYILLALTLGLALMSVEMALGRATRTGVSSAFRKLGNRHWSLFGYITVLAALIIMGFYSVVGGWSLAYAFNSLAGNVVSSDNAVLAANFNALISHPLQSVLWHGGFLALTALVVAGGVQRGIETMSRWLMPLLFVLMLVLIARGITLPGAMAGVEFLLKPDFSKLSFETVLAALGLAFFSLSLGMGAMVTYGAYLNRDTDLPASAGWVVALTLVACLLGGLLVLPPVFAQGIDPQAGPGLTFISMPSIFAAMPAGGLFATLFFLLLLVAALTSAVSLVEVCIRFAEDELKMKRKTAVAAFSAVIFALGIPAALSFGIWSELKLFGRNPFDLMDYLSSNLLLPAGGIAIAVFAAWFCWHEVAAQLRHEDAPRHGLLRATRTLIGVIAPLAISIILIRGL